MPNTERWLERRIGPTLAFSRRWSVGIEWEPRDLWIGAFVKRERGHFLAPAWHIYVCPVPTVVLHVVWMGPRPIR